MIIGNWVGESILNCKLYKDGEIEWDHIARYSSICTNADPKALYGSVANRYTGVNKQTANESSLKQTNTLLPPKTWETNSACSPTKIRVPSQMVIEIKHRVTCKA